MSDYYFYQNQRNFYKVQARNKDHALEILKRHEDEDDFDDRFLDRIETCMDWEFYFEHIDEI